MSITHLRKWDVTPIEIAIDLETPQLPDPASFRFSGPAEPRICLVAGFALTSHLKRIATAVDRALPERAPPQLRIAPSTTRSPTMSATNPISVRPMPPLLRLQSKVLRAIEPGLAHIESPALLSAVRDMGEAAAAYVRDFVLTKALPTFEPCSAAKTFDPIDVKPIGVTIYRLGRLGSPESILANWTYPQDARHTLHLRGGP